MTGFVLDAADGSVRLELRHAGGDRYEARLDADGAGGRVELRLDRRRFEDFFASLARDWAGWDGPRELLAMYPDPVYSPGPALRIAAIHDRTARVRVVLAIGRPHLGIHDRPDVLMDPRPAEVPLPARSWQLSAHLELEPWQLDDLARGAAALPSDSS